MTNVELCVMAAIFSGILIRGGTTSFFELIPEHRERVLLELVGDVIYNTINFTYTGFIEVTVKNSSGKAISFMYTNKTATRGCIGFVNGDFGEFGEHKITLTAKVLHFEHSETTTVLYEERIWNVSINIPEFAAAGTPVKMDADCPYGSNVMTKWDISQSNSSKYYGFCSDKKIQSALSHRFNDTGDFAVNVTLFNSVSEVAVYKEVTVLRPVHGFSVEVAPHEPADPEETTGDLLLNAIDDDSFELMGDLFVDVDDGDKRKLNAHALEYSPNKPQQRKVLIFNVGFGTRRIRVRVFNAVSEQNLTTDVDIWPKISAGLHLGRSVIFLGDLLDLILGRKHEWGFNYILDYGDGEKNTSLDNDVPRRPLSDDIYLRHFYKHLGTYNVSLYAYNQKHHLNLTDQVRVLSDFQVSVAESLVTLPDGYISSEISTERTEGLGRILCDLDFGDSSEPISTSLANSPQQHRYDVAGNFKITYNCLVDDQFHVTQTSVLVKRFSASDFRINYDPVISKNTSHPVVVVLGIDLFGVKRAPPGVTFAWDFGDETEAATESLMTWQKEHTFTKRGNFNITVTISVNMSDFVTMVLPIRVGMFNFETNITKGLMNYDVFGFTLRGPIDSILHFILDYDDGSSLEKLFSDRNGTQTTAVTLPKVYSRARTYAPVMTLYGGHFFEEIALPYALSVYMNTNVMRLDLSPIIQSPPGVGTLLFQLNAKILSMLDNELITCLVDYDDGTPVDSFKVEVSNTNNFTVDHHFAAMGHATVTANCSSLSLTRQSLKVSTLIMSTCYGSEKLFSNLESPLRRVVSEQFILAANPRIRCLNMTPEFHWRVDAIINESEIIYPVEQSGTTLLVLNARAVDPGLYKITFYTHFKEKSTIYNSDSIMLIYDRSPLISRIKGGTMKTVGHSQPIVLDGSTYSLDPDAMPYAGQGLEFSWRCSKHVSYTDALRAAANVSTYTECCSACEAVSGTTNGIVVLTPKCLQVETWHLFYLTVYKDTRSSNAFQIIHVIDRSPPQMDLRCKVNCLAKVNAEFSFSLETECLDCPRNERRAVSFNWKLFRVDTVTSSKHIEESFDRMTSTGRNISTMSIRPYSLTPGKVYLLEMTIATPDRPSGMLHRKFMVNYPPYNGTCVLIPSQGVAVLDRFRIVCDGWIDEGDNLQRSHSDNGESLAYSFVMWVGNTHSLLYSGGNRMTPPQELNAGKPEHNFNISISARIFDAYKGMAEVLITGRVTPPMLVSKTSDKLSELDALLGTFDDRLSEAMLTGDIHEVSRLTESATSALSLLGSDDKESQSYGSDRWLGIKPVDLRNNGSGEMWEDLWANYLSPEENQMQEMITEANTHYLKNLTSLVNSTHVPSLESAYMVSSSLGALLDSPEYVDMEELELRDFVISYLVKCEHDKYAAIDTMETLGDTVTSMVTVDMSDTQVDEVLDSIFGAVNNAVETITPAEIFLDDTIDHAKSRKAIDISRDYRSPNSLRMLKENMEKADINDAERAFLMTREKLQFQYKAKLKEAVAKARMPRLLDTIDKILDTSAKFLVEGQESAKFVSNSISSSVEKNSLKEVMSRTTQTGESTIGIHSEKQEMTNNTQPVILKTTTYKKNPFVSGEKNIVTRITSQAVVVNMTIDSTEDTDPYNTNGTTNRTVAYTITLPNSSPVNFTNISPMYISLDRDKLLYHKLELKSVDDTLILYVKPSVPNMEYGVYFRSGQFPTTSDYDYYTSVRFQLDMTKGPLVIKCPPRKLPSKGTVYLGLKPKIIEGVQSERERRDTVDSEPALESLNQSLGINAEYDLSVTAVGCAALIESVDSWDLDICGPSNVSTSELTACVCDVPITSKFTIATTFYVPINTVDFSTVFTEIDLQNNASVFVLVLIVITFYIFLSIWARRKDNTDILKWGLTSLLDNSPFDRYLYVVTVFTGMRLNAGTKSNVGFVVAGDDADTGTRSLFDGVRKSMPTQSVTHYLMAVQECLGDLEYIRIWHDNSGKGPMASWFLHKIIVEDIQLDKKYTFHCDRWLAVDRDDGVIERLLPVSSKENLLKFSHLFYSNARKNVADNHVWFSVIIRPQRSHFTRVQRLSCCVSLLFLSMICNALFYHSKDNNVRPTTINLGFLRLSINQLYTSCVSILIVTPIELAIIWLFKKSKPRWESLEQESSQSCFLTRVSDEQKKLTNSLVAKGVYSTEGITLPHFCVYLAWTLIFLSISISAFFVFLLSQQWGRSKSEEWLASFLLSFFESLAILDPLKVVFLAMFFALFVRKLEEQSSNGLKNALQTNGLSIGHSMREHRQVPKVEPLDAKALKNATKHRLKETKAIEQFKEIGLYLIFLVVMCCLAYTNRDFRSFYLRNTLYNMLVMPKSEGQPAFGSVVTVEDYFVWLNKTVLPSLFHEHDYNGDRRHWTNRIFIQDMQNVRVGPTRIRQVRSVRDGSCPFPWVGSALCVPPSTEHEETRDFCIGWKEPPCSVEEAVSRLTSSAWKHSASDEIWGLPVEGVYNTYSGAGYIAMFAVNLDVSAATLNELLTSQWVDRNTRALTVDFTVYNANNNLFCFVSLLAEFPLAGGTLTSVTIMPFRGYLYDGSVGYFLFLVEILFIIVLAVAVVKFGLKLFRHGCGYVKDMWHVVDCLCLLTCIAAIVVYGLRKLMAEIAMHKMMEDSDTFVNFQHVTFWDTCLISIVGALTFSCTIRAVKILGYSRRLNALLAVLANATKYLLNFSVMLIIMLMGFVITGYFLFGRTLKAYHTITYSLITLLTCLIGKSPYLKMIESETVLARIYFTAFVFFVMFVLMTMFRVILNESTANVRTNIDKISTQHEMLHLLLRNLKDLFKFLISKDKHQDEGMKGCPDENATDRASTSTTLTGYEEPARSSTGTRVGYLELDRKSVGSAWPDYQRSGGTMSSYLEPEHKSVRNLRTAPQWPGRSSFSVEARYRDLGRRPISAPWASYSGALQSSAGSGTEYAKPGQWSVRAAWVERQKTDWNTVSVWSSSQPTNEINNYTECSSAGTSTLSSNEQTQASKHRGITEDRTLHELIHIRQGLGNRKASLPCGRTYGSLLHEQGLDSLRGETLETDKSHELWHSGLRRELLIEQRQFSQHLERTRTGQRNMLTQEEMQDSQRQAHTHTNQQCAQMQAKQSCVQARVSLSHDGRRTKGEKTHEELCLERAQVIQQLGQMQADDNQEQTLDSLLHQQNRFSLRCEQADTHIRRQKTNTSRRHEQREANQHGEQTHQHLGPGHRQAHDEQTHTSQCGEQKQANKHREQAQTNIDHGGRRGRLRYEQTEVDHRCERMCESLSVENEKYSDQKAYSSQLREHTQVGQRREQTQTNIYHEQRRDSRFYARDGERFTNSRRLERQDSQSREQLQAQLKNIIKWRALENIYMTSSSQESPYGELSIASPRNEQPQANLHHEQIASGHSREQRHADQLIGEQIRACLNTRTTETTLENMNLISNPKR